MENSMGFNVEQKKESIDAKISEQQVSKFPFHK